MLIIVSIQLCIQQPVEKVTARRTEDANTVILLIIKNAPSY